MPVRFLAVYSRSDGGSVPAAYQPAAINLTRQNEFSVFAVAVVKTRWRQWASPSLKDHCLCMKNPNRKGR